MGWRAWLLGMGASGLAGCNPSLADYCAQGTPECSPADAAAPDGDVAVGREADVAVGREAAAEASACDPTQAPHDASCVLTEAYGVFVSPSGSDSNIGTRVAPARTIGHGMDLAKAAGKRVYVCAGSFEEPLVVASTRDGVSVYGALDCATWSYAAANKVVIAPAAAGYALELEGLQVRTTFEDLEFDAQNAAPGVAGGSSVAVFASGSQNVALQRVVMVAGNATDGTSGASPGGADGGGNPSNWYGTPPGHAELDGKGAGDAGAAPATTCVCSDQSTSTGGAGGGAINMSTPTAGLPSYGEAGAGAGGTNAVSCGSGGTAQNGADAPMHPADTPSTSLGSCSASGWSPGVGVAGADGKPGQGGGGGGNGRLSNGSGGGGACGGCGGAGGPPGQGGGSSIALLSYQSSVGLVDCVLTAKAAGNGGAGGSGQAGQSGGVIGGDGTQGGCQGGGGGAGAGGNGGQGGPGGLSLGVGYAGTAPTIHGAVVSQAASYAGITLGTAGAGGAAGSRGAAAADSTGTSGVDGMAGPSALAAAVGALP